MCGLCSIMIHTTYSKLIAAILVACALSTACAQSTEGISETFITQRVSETFCTQQVSGKPGPGMRAIAVREREVQFCPLECENDNLCQAYMAPDAELDVCALFPSPPLSFTCPVQPWQYVGGFCTFLFERSVLLHRGTCEPRVGFTWWGRWSRDWCRLVRARVRSKCGTH